MTTSPPLQKIIHESCTQKMKASKTMREHTVPNQKRRKDKESEYNIDSGVHNQTLKQQNN
jgi:hypothetical protein